MKVLGLLLVILGIITMVFGGLGLAIYYIYDLVMNWDTLTKGEIFWHIVWLVLRDVLAVVAGAIMFVVGSVMSDN